MMHSLAHRMTEQGYDGYAYAYPHKTAYRPLDPPAPLRDAWVNEEKHRLFLYVHLPFCEMRCGFCNLFTTVQPEGSLVSRTLDAIERQSQAVAHAIQPERIAQAAFGGGTPSFLSESELISLFERLTAVWPVQWTKIPVSLEVSPGTVTQQKLQLLKSLGVDRISLGVQSFIHEDLVALKRPQPPHQLERACQWIKNAGFHCFNIDLIYGNEGQDEARWEKSIYRALEWQPEELYLYPLYVGKLTKLDKSGKKPGDCRRDLYRRGRDILLGSGYRQISMRLFRRADVLRATDYCCQDDGMIGLGAGARSYTRSLHYSSEYAVGQPGVRNIIESFNTRPASSFGYADYGIVLNEAEQRRRYVIKSLLRADGLSRESYGRRFGSSLADDFRELAELFEIGLANETNGVLRLTEEGFAWSDTIGPWLYSDAMQARMNDFEFA